MYFFKISKWFEKRLLFLLDFTGHRNFLLRRICLYFLILLLNTHQGIYESFPQVQSRIPWCLCERRTPQTKSLSTYGQRDTRDVLRSEVRRATACGVGRSAEKDWSRATWKNLLLSFNTCFKLFCSLSWKRRCCACTGFTIPRPLT